MDRFTSTSRDVASFGVALKYELISDKSTSSRILLVSDNNLPAPEKKRTLKGQTPMRPGTKR
jgi:hypothetical protein